MDKNGANKGRGWERLTQKVIDIVAQKRTRGVVFMAWGTPAGKRVQKIDRVKHLVLQSVHPSPLSASRGFFDCNHFKKANDWLVQRYGPDGEIDWALAPGASTKAPVKESDEKEAKVAEKKADAIEKAKPEVAKKVEENKENDADYGEDEEALEEALRLAEEEENEKKK